MLIRLPSRRYLLSGDATARVSLSWSAPVRRVYIDGLRPFSRGCTMAEGRGRWGTRHLIDDPVGGVPLELLASVQTPYHAAEVFPFDNSALSTSVSRIRKARRTAKEDLLRRASCIRKRRWSMKSRNGPGRRRRPLRRWKQLSAISLSYRV